MIARWPLLACVTVCLLVPSKGYAQPDVGTLFNPGSAAGASASSSTAAKDQASSDAPAAVEPPPTTSRTAGEPASAGDDVATVGTSSVALSPTSASYVGQAVTDSGIKSALERLETDDFVFGVFPNDAGFIDARLHLRKHYLGRFSSGVYLDYTTARAIREKPGVERADRLVREYRLEGDILKGILMFLNTRYGRSGTAASIEPGLNFKLLYQEIDASGYQRNSFDELQFRGSTARFYSFIGSLKLDSTLAIVERFTFDVSGEWLPLLYTIEKDRTISSQFGTPVTSTITNRTTGFQATAALKLNLDSYGRYALRGRVYRNHGQVSARSLLASGAFQYEFETYSDAVREDYWLEFVHTATYIKLFGVLAPGIGVAVQRKRFETQNDLLQADVLKFALLLELI